MFSMLLLVLGDSWLTVFAAWELVGLCSYLLIGFWYHALGRRSPRRRRSSSTASATSASPSAIMLIWASTGTLNIRESFELLAEASTGIDDRCARLPSSLFMGAVGKSAQFPLHVWLPDAMEGPTPVSALIHAATMVNAGVYLVARGIPIFALRPGVMVVVAAIGIFTAILAASIALHPDRHQARPRLLHALPARLHVRRARRRRLRRGHLPPHDPRLLQGPALPRLRLASSTPSTRSRT